MEGVLSRVLAVSLPPEHNEGNVVPPVPPAVLPQRVEQVVLDDPANAERLLLGVRMQDVVVANAGKPTWSKGKKVVKDYRRN